MFIKKFILITILILTQSCGFSPMYSKSNLDSNFYIVELKFDGDRLINNYLENGLAKFNNIDANKKYKIEIFTDYKKNILTKDLTGTATDYELLLNTTLIIPSSEELHVVLNTEIGKLICPGSFISWMISADEQSFASTKLKV